MKISELIKELQIIYEDNEDIEVFIEDKYDMLNIISVIYPAVIGDGDACVIKLGKVL